MNTEKIKALLATVAPTLATAIGGPLAGVAAQAITGKLSGQAAADLGRVEELLASASGDDMVKLKEVEAEFAAKMKQAGVDMARIDADDRHSARDRQVRMRDWTPSILGVLIIIGFFGVLAYFVRFGLPGEGSEVILIVVGALSAMVAQVGNYFFGSSVGSKNKDVTIAGLKAGLQ